MPTTPSPGIPAMGIAGLIVFLLYHNPELRLRLYLAGGAMLGFLSHLILDELCSVDIAGATLKLNKYAGSALKLWSVSTLATLTTYGVFAGLSYLAMLEVEGRNVAWPRWQSHTLQISPRDRPVGSGK